MLFKCLSDLPLHKKWVFGYQRLPLTSIGRDAYTKSTPRLQCQVSEVACLFSSYFMAHHNTTAAVPVVAFMKVADVELYIAFMEAADVVYISCLHKGHGHPFLEKQNKTMHHA